MSLPTRYRLINPPHAGLEWQVQHQLSPVERRELSENGFIVRTDLFDSQTILKMRAAVDDLAAMEASRGIAEFTRWGQYIPFLIEKHEVFLQLVYHKKLIGIAREALGPQVQFDLVDARITKSAKEVVEWHIHNQCVVEPAPLFPCYPHSIHVLVYLDDISEDNGALCVMPGSHRNPSNPCPVGDRAHEDLPGQVVISCPAGTSVVVHAHLWHRTISPRQREIDRRMLIVGFLPACVKSTTHQSDEFYRRGSPSERLTSQLRVGDDPEIRELLGEYFWP